MTRRSVPVVSRNLNGQGNVNQVLTTPTFILKVNTDTTMHIILVIRASALTVIFKIAAQGVCSSTLSTPPGYPPSAILASTVQRQILEGTTQKRIIGLG